MDDITGEDVRCGAGGGEVFCDKDPDHLSFMHHDSATGVTWVDGYDESCEDCGAKYRIDGHTQDCDWWMPSLVGEQAGGAVPTGVSDGLPDPNNP